MPRFFSAAGLAVAALLAPASCLVHATTGEMVRAAGVKPE